MTELRFCVCDIKKWQESTTNGFCHRGHRERQRRKSCYGNDYGNFNSEGTEDGNDNNCSRRQWL
jgi:hypothetical protein